MYVKIIDDFTHFCSCSSSSLSLSLHFQKLAAYQSRMHRGWREAYGAVAFHGLGEPQAVLAAVQASRS